MKPKIYISGRITDNPNYIEQFQECQDFLLTENIFYPINPAATVSTICTKLKLQNPSWENYMKIALKLMLDDDCYDIVLLPGFWSSRGAMAELRIAFDLKYRIHYFIDGKREYV